MRYLFLLLVVSGICACSGGDHEELRQWMEENSRDLKGKVPKLPEVMPYQPVPYDAEGAVDPFKGSKLEPEGRNRPGSGAGLIQPDYEARELRNSLLEKFPLESLKMIGFMNVNKIPRAVIQVDNKVKQVKVGDYIGLDFGVITAIKETEVQLKELIQDSAGDWSERRSSLHLQSKEGSK